MPFAPGQSGNPSGRPKADPAIREAARAHAEEALQVFVANMRDDNPAVRHKAAEALLDRGFGKPVQMVGGDADNPVRALIQWATPPK